MANTSFTQQALAIDPRFQVRVRAALAKVAWEIISEDANTAFHAEREAYARSILPNVALTAAQIAPWLVERTNLIAFETSYDFAASAVVTAAGDPDIENQLHTDWNVLAGV